MRADVVASHGRTGSVGALSIASVGRLSRLLDFVALVRDFINAFINGEIGVLKIFRAVAEMDRVFTEEAEM